MGLSLHYSGRFRESASLSKLIDEVENIAVIREWEYHIFEREFPAGNMDENSYDDNIYGICFTPPGCETVSICFLSNRRLSCFTNLKFYGNSNSKEYQEYLYMLSVKTQFAGVETHIFIIEFFRHLIAQGYFEDLEIIDEGKYWETGDENLLNERFKRNADLINNFAFAIEQFPMKNGESYETYFGRLADMVRNKENN